MHWWQSWARIGSSRPQSWVLCVWHFRKPEKLYPWEATFPYWGFRGVCYSWLPSLELCCFPPSLSLTNLWSSLPPKTLPITFPALLEIHAFDQYFGSSCGMWWGRIQSDWLINSGPESGNESVLWVATNFDGVILFWFLSDGLSRTVLLRYPEAMGWSYLCLRGAHPWPFALLYTCLFNISYLKIYNL